MTCYPLSNSNKGKVKPPPLYTVFGDALVGDQVDVPVPPTRLQFLCAPGSYFQSVNTRVRRARPFRPPDPGASLGRS